MQGLFLCRHTLRNVCEVFEILENIVKGEKQNMKRQDKVRQQVKLAKALNDEWSYKAMSEVIGISTHAFYNWLNGAY